MAEPIPCMHTEGGQCYLRQCLRRGCKKAAARGLTWGTGKLPDWKPPPGYNPQLYRKRPS